MKPNALLRVRADAVGVIHPSVDRVGVGAGQLARVALDAEHRHVDERRALGRVVAHDRGVELGEQVGDRSLRRLGLNALGAGGEERVDGVGKGRGIGLGC